MLLIQEIQEILFDSTVTRILLARTCICQLQLCRLASQSELLTTVNAKDVPAFPYANYRMVGLIFHSCAAANWCTRLLNRSTFRYTHLIDEQSALSDSKIDDFD